MKVLIIEDDQEVLNKIQDSLNSAGFICDHDVNGLDAMYSMRSMVYDVILLDLNIPLISGLELLSKIRQQLKLNTPVIVISGINNIQTKINCFNQGADDFLVKPFETQELIARIYAVKRRFMGYSSSVIEYGNIALNTKKNIAYINDKQVMLTKKEYVILEMLIMNKGGVVSKESILDALYINVNEEPQAKIIDVFMCKLRKKLTNAGAMVKINTIWGRGSVINLIKGPFEANEINNETNDNLDNLEQDTKQDKYKKIYN